MAYVGRQVEVAREGDVAVGRVVDHVVDPRTGFVAERERIAVQVPTEDGGTAVVMGERIRAVRVVSTSLYLSTYILYNMFVFFHDHYSQHGFKAIVSNQNLFLYCFFNHCNIKSILSFTVKNEQ